MTKVQQSIMVASGSKHDFDVKIFTLHEILVDPKYLCDKNGFIKWFLSTFALEIESTHQRGNHIL